MKPCAGDSDSINEVKNFVPDYTDKQLYSTHDGASVMIKTSRLLKVRNWNHCVAHALHLLLTTDSLQKVPSVMAVLNKCKNIVNTVHFKGDVLEREVRNNNDQAAFSDLMDKVMDLTALVNAGNLYSVDEENSSESENDEDTCDNTDAGRSGRRKPTVCRMKSALDGIQVWR